MKKMIIMAFTMAIFGSASYSQTTASATPVSAQQDQKVKIENSALPDAVKTTLAGEGYKGWTVASAWQINAATPYFIVELKKDNQTTTVKLDKDGKQIS